MKAQLDLALVPVLGNLIHIAALKSQLVSCAITDGIVKTVAIKVLDLIIITNVLLTVYKNFIIKCVVKGYFDQFFPIQRDIDDQVISKACTKVLVFNPTPLKPGAVIDVNSPA